MSDVIIEVRGGNVVEVYSALLSLRIAVVDWDNLEGEGSRPRVVGNCCNPYEMLPPDTRRILLNSGCLRSGGETSP